MREMKSRAHKRSYVEIKGERAATTITTDAPRFYLFVPDEKNVHTPFLVRLVNKGQARRVTAIGQRGQRGFAIDSEEIIMPHYRVLASDGGMLYMEFRTRQPLPRRNILFGRTCDASRLRSPRRPRTREIKPAQKDSPTA